METTQLAGVTIAVPETRQLDILARLFEQRGAAVIRCPLVAIVDAPDQAPVEAWLHRFVDGACDDLILLTGEGLRRLVGAADRMGIREPFVDALADVRKITRGPKPVRALREVGLDADLQATEPTTEGVIAELSGFDLSRRTVGVQLYGEEQNTPLMDFLKAAGAVAEPVAPYVYASEVDDVRVADLIGRISEGSVNVIAFTSASQIRRLWSVAKKRGLEDTLRTGLSRTIIASVGPVTADEARRYDMNPTIIPARIYSMKPFVNEIVEAMRMTT